MSLLSRKRARNRIIGVIIFLVISLISMPFILKAYKIFSIKKSVIEDFQENNIHSRILRKYTDETEAENFYFYIEYREGNSFYVAEYLCQNINGRWIFHFIAKTPIKI